ncbi:phage head closure protein [Amphiplicatus metriothermophilus]|uniref:Phage head-tail adaptor, putative, SPP1 family n=1 Tax=Amphiplicatus metriothermophilus TaxID=1519374 RepID=A0A239PIH0_9PROT|nr:phage head closure protein [Amphiplicatus metriothermophilus]MBB5518088.1 SPP1 family predicted phage head-tail adaptor [Amphiplicatus metriothermophilus]SNT67578.1 phage head-tail adaptor, putative, SPP1 family [Amphiplicatus metriothermophilus]
MTGSLNQLIELLAPARVPDAAGGASEAWTVYATAWAAVERLAAAREGTGPREAFRRRAAATIRARNDVALGHRARIGGDDYDIVSIESDARQSRLVLVCEEAAS